MFELVITADTNDADYVTEISKVTQEDIDRMLPIIALIKAADKYGHNWMKGEIAGTKDNFRAVYGDRIAVEELEWFDEGFVPYGEYGIHTIESIEYYPLPTKIKLL